MSVKMKFISKVTAAVFGSALLLSAVPASAQVSSVDALLNDIRQNAEQVRRENAKRVADFEARANQQSSLLNQAKQELRTLESRARKVTSAKSSDWLALRRVSLRRF